MKITLLNPTRILVYVFIAFSAVWLPAACLAGTISGTVTVDGGTPLQDVIVRAYSDYCQNGYLGEAATGSAGTYSISGIPDGAQAYLWADSVPTGQNLTQEWYDGGEGNPDCWHAQPVVDGATGVEIPLESAGSITGTVTDTGGVAINNMHVFATLYDADCNGYWLSGANTNSYGVYQLDHIPPGDVVIRTCSECSSLNYVNEFYDNVLDCSSATPINITAGNTFDSKDFQLDQGGTISGYVYAQGGTTPIAGVNVNIYSDLCHNGHMYGVQTDGDGYFEFRGLPLGGQYILRADSNNENYYISQWYNNVSDTEDCNNASWVDIGDNVVFNMVQGGAVSGTARDSGGNPILGVSVQIEVIEGDPCGENRWVAGMWTDPADGTFTVSGIPAGDYYLVTSPAESNYIGEWWTGGDSSLDCGDAQSFTVSTGVTSTGFEFQLEVGGAITGHVYQAGTATGIEGVTVHFYSDYCYNGQMYGEHTDEDGYFAFRGLPLGGQYILKADSNNENYYISQFYDNVTDSEDCTNASWVTVGDDVVFNMVQGGAVSGTARDSGGSPINGVSVQIDVIEGDPCGENYYVTGVWTDPANGTYTVSGIPAGTYYIRTSHAESNYIGEWWTGGASSLDCDDAQPFTVTSGVTSTGFEFQLEEGGAVSGTVREAGTNQPIANVHVYAVDDACDGQWLGGTNTDENGFYRINAVATGSAYIRTAAASGGFNFIDESWDDAQDCSDATEIVVSVGSEVTDRDFHLSPGGTISGHVYAQGGTTPIAGVNVNIYSDLCHNGHLYSVQTDVTGYFEFTGLPLGGQFIVRADSHGTGQYYIGQWYDHVDDTADCESATFVPVNAPSITFNLSLGGAVSGVVRDSAGDPITGVSVQVDVIAGNPCGDHQGVNSVWTDPIDGTFTITGIPEGTYFLRTWHAESDYVGEWWSSAGSSLDCSAAQSFNVSAGVNSPGFDFHLDKGGYVTGTVTDSSANPIQNLWMEAFTGQCWNNWSGGASTDENGNYTIGPLAPGDYYIFACANCSTPDYVEAWWNGGQGTLNCNAATSVNVDAEQTYGAVNFSLNTWSSISGTITGYSNVPLPGVTVEAFYDCHGWFAGSAVTDENGDYTIDGLTEGDYLIKINGIYYNDVQYPETWLNADSCNASTRVHVNPEQQVAGTDVPVEPGFTVIGSVMNVQNPDGTFQTNIEAELDGYMGPLPDDVLSIAIRLKRPDGSESLIASYPQDAFEYLPQWKDFFIAVPGVPEVGYYEMEVTTAYATETGQDYQTIIRTIPVPDNQTFSPASGETLFSTTPVFSWAPVVMDDPDAPPLFYRLEVADMSGNRVWASGRAEGMTSCAVPEGRLQPAENYQWRVRVTDSGDWVETQNRTNSQWVPFTMAGILSHGARPAIDLDNYGVASYSHYGGTGLDVWLNIIDQDGVAENGSSHHVTLTKPDSSTVDMSFNYARGTVGSYSYWSNSYPQAGTYTIKVTDPEGNWSSVGEELVVNPISPATESSITPSNMNEFITATFDNVIVNDNSYDDFSTYSDIWSLDPNKWNLTGDCAAIVDQALRLDVSGTVGRGDCSLSVADPASVDTIQADITVNSVSSNNSPRARIRGLFYFNGFGDVSGTINVKGNHVYYNVSEEYLFNGVYSWKTLAEETLMSVTVGQTVTAKIHWDGATLTFSATDANSSGPVFSSVYTAPGLVVPPTIGREMLLQIRTNLVTSDTTPIFTWDPVTSAERYRLQIYDARLQRTLWRGYTSDTQYTIPPGVLQPDSYYQFRIVPYRDHSPLNQDNCAGTDKYRFYTSSIENPTPSIEFDSAGVETWNGDDMDPYLSFWVMVHDAQGVPGNIRSVKVRFPDGVQEVALLHDTTRDPSPTSGFYRNDVFMDPTGMDGIYTFIVEDWDGNTYETSEMLTVDPIGYPDPGTFNTVVTGTALDVDWDDVPGAAFYRLEIYDRDFNRIHTFATTESQYSVPEGVLKADTMYRYRINTRREFFDQNVDNGSTSPWSRYDYPSFVTTPETGTFPPTADIDGYGVYLWHTPKEGGVGETWLLGFSLKVSDDDGVPENIKQVRVTFPDGTTTRDLVFDSVISNSEGSYWVHEFYGVLDDIPDGIYTFTVTDFNDVSVQVVDELVKNDLPIPLNCQPASGATIVDTTPVISWDSVPGAAAYRVRIYEGIDTTIHTSESFGGTTYTLPSGLLAVGKTYNYRVYAYRENFPVEEVDNISVNAIFPGERPYFTVAADDDGDGVANVFDNCPELSNANQVDTDVDGIGNYCDDDADGDGLTNDVDEDDDGDGLPDDWENAYALDPLDDTGINGSAGDPDNDGWNNGEELLYGTLPDSDADVPPPLIAETIPHDGAGIDPDNTRVASSSVFAILVRDPGGIDLTDSTSVELTIDDGVNPAYDVDLSSAALSITKLNTTPDNDCTRFWVTYHRSDDVGFDWDYDTTVLITADLRDSLGTADRVSRLVEFRIETEDEQQAAAAASPPVVPVPPDDPIFDETDYAEPAGVQVTDPGDPLEGAAIVYDQSESVTPSLGPVDELPVFDAPSADAVGVPLNLQPPAVFVKPVKIRIPCPGFADVSILDVHYFNGTDWVLACTPSGVAPTGEDWVVDGSRVNRNDLTPPVIELKVYHFSGAQAVLPKIAHWADDNVDWDVDGSDLAALLQQISDGSVGDVAGALSEFAPRYGRLQ